MCSTQVVPSRPLSFLIIPPPPTSTLFPYTTLFRSIPRLVASLDVSDNDPVIGVLNHLVDVADHLRPIEVQIKPKLDGRFSVRRDPDDLPRSLLLDRKSTRLNFSHVRISYAVFCLKK